MRGLANLRHSLTRSVNAPSNLTPSRTCRDDALERVSGVLKLTVPRLTPRRDGCPREVAIEIKEAAVAKARHPEQGSRPEITPCHWPAPRLWRRSTVGWKRGELERFAGQGEWEGLRSADRVESVCPLEEAAPTAQRRYYLSSLAVDEEKFARAVRGGQPGAQPPQILTRVSSRFPPLR